MPNYKSSRGLVLLKEHIETSATATGLTWALTNATFSQYSHFLLIINGIKTATLQLNVKVNDVTGGHYDDGMTIIGGTETLIDNGAVNFWELMSIELSTDPNFFIELTINSPPITGAEVMAFSRATSGTGYEAKGHWLQAASAAGITDMVFAVSTSSWVLGTTFRLYGQRK